MARVPREAGMRAFGWVDVENRQVVYQRFIFAEFMAAVRFKPYGFEVAEVYFDGNFWVENVAE